MKAYALALGLAAAGIAHAQAPAASAPAGPGLFSSLVYAPGVGLQSRDWRTQCAGQLPPTQVSVAVMPSHITYNRPSSLELTHYFQMALFRLSMDKVLEWTRSHRGNGDESHSVQGTARLFGQPHAVAA